MNTATAAARAGAGSFREVWVISSGHALTHWYPATFYLLLPLIGKELGLSYAQIGFTMTMQYLAGALANLPGGMVVDTVGRKGLLMALSLFWIGFPYLLMSLTHSYWMLLVCVVLVGIGNNLWHPTAISTLAHRFPDRKGLVLSLHGMGGNIGEAAAPLVIGALLAVLSWREVVIVNIVPGVVMAAMILVFLGSLTLDAPHAPANRTDGRSLGSYFSGFRRLLRNRAIILISVSGVFRSMTQSSLLTFLPLYLGRELGYSTFWIGAGMFALQVAGFTSAPVSGHLSDRMGRRRVMISSMLMSAIVLVTMALAGKSPAFIVLIAVLGFFLYATRPVIQAWALECAPREMAGTAVGLLFGLQAVGASISPVVSGVIADAWGIYAVFYFLAATIVVANCLIFFMPKDAGEAAKPSLVS